MTITFPLYLPTLISISVPVFALVSSLLFGYLSLLMGLPKWASSSADKYLQIEGERGAWIAASSTAAANKGADTATAEPFTTTSFEL